MGLHHIVQAGAKRALVALVQQPQLAVRGRQPVPLLQQPVRGVIAVANTRALVEDKRSQGHAIHRRCKQGTLTLHPGDACLQADGLLDVGQQAQAQRLLRRGKVVAPDDPGEAQACTVAQRITEIRPHQMPDAGGFHVLSIIVGIVVVIRCHELVDRIDLSRRQVDKWIQREIALVVSGVDRR